MVYSNLFVLCLLIDGKPIEEAANGSVSIPLNSAYSIRLRNKNVRRAVAKIFIDGENVSGNGYIVGAKDYVDIHRHHDKDAGFKFVSLNSPDAVDAGKNGPNENKIKGTLKVEFYLEKEVPVAPKITEIHHHHYPFTRYRYPYSSNDFTIYGSGMQMSSGPSIGSNGIAGSLGGSFGGGGSYSSQQISCSLPNNDQNAILRSASKSLARNIEGCTVEGEKTGQSFYTTHIETEDTATILTLFITGHEVEQPKLVSRELEEANSEIARLKSELNRLETLELKRKIKAKKKKLKV